jgi:signal transduction histidine kinase
VPPSPERRPTRDTCCRATGGEGVRRGQDGRRRGLHFVLLAVTVVLAVLGVALTAAAWSHLAASDSYSTMGLFIGAVVYAWLGAIVLQRTTNTIGWILLGEGIGLTLNGILSALAVLGAAHPGRVPGWDVMGLLAELLFIPVIFGLALMLLLFPTGDVPSPRWRVVELIILFAFMLSLVATALTPTQVALPAPGGVSLVYPNPLGMSFLRGTFIGTTPGLGAISVPLFAVCVAALVVRYRSGRAELRQQIKWLALVAGAFAVTQVVLTVLLVVASDSPFTLGVGFLSGYLALFGFPIAITIAILRYRLYEIDLILNRAVVYTLLAAAVTAVYVAIVAGVGTLVGSHGGPLLTIVAAIAIALLFQPLRRRAQRLANRVVYGERATPYQVLSEFADAMARTVPLEEQLDEMVSLLASGTGATAIEVWITVGRSLRAIAVWPLDAPTPEPRAMPDAGGPEDPPDATAVFPVRQGVELLGQIVLYKPRNEPLSPTEATLADHVASQAGLVVRNVRLTEELRNTIEELRASRRRLVDAQDLERRKIERNLHDGAQQQLVGLGVQLGLLERLARDIPDAARLTATIPQLQATLTDALGDLRDLARGIYPPLLADQGLSAALDAQARKAAVPTSVDADGIGRYDRAVEAAVYFCTLEALQNVAKYADASTATVRLGVTDGWLTFLIEDDGRGFDPDEAKGSGIQGMADRLDAIGGNLEIESERGGGTVVRGRIPASAID